MAFIFNPAAGQGNAARRRSRLAGLLQRAGLAGDLRQTSLARGAGALAREAVADGAARVIISGGDGSVMEAAGALAGTGVALGVVPGGTGNLVALNLGIPRSAGPAVRLAFTGRPTAIDLGCCNGTPFVLMAGMGWDAQMIQDAGRGMKRRFGVLAYFWAALKNLARPAAVYRIRIDGPERDGADGGERDGADGGERDGARSLLRRARTVLVANLGRITGGLPVIPGADPRDGLLEVAILRAESLRDVAGLLWSALRGQIRDDPRLERHRGREIVVETRRPQPLQLDGNNAGETTRAAFRVLERALLVVLPEDTACSLPQTAGRCCESYVRVGE